MRIARRREDGVWEFYETDAAGISSSQPLRDPTVPLARPSMDPFASRLSLAPSHLTRSTTYLTSSDTIPSPTSSSYTYAAKKEEKDVYTPGYSTTRASGVEEGPPPPAYTRSHVETDGGVSTDRPAS
jgi:hypothetical protein